MAYDFLIEKYNYLYEDSKKAEKYLASSDEEALKMSVGIIVENLCRELYKNAVEEVNDFYSLIDDEINDLDDQGKKKESKKEPISFETIILELRDKDLVSEKSFDVINNIRIARNQARHSSINNDCVMPNDIYEAGESVAKELFDAILYLPKKRFEILKSIDEQQFLEVQKAYSYIDYDPKMTIIKLNKVFEILCFDAKDRLVLQLDKDIDFPVVESYLQVLVFLEQNFLITGNHLDFLHKLRMLSNEISHSRREIKPEFALQIYNDTSKMPLLFEKVFDAVPCIIEDIKNEANEIKDKAQQGEKCINDWYYLYGGKKSFDNFYHGNKNMTEHFISRYLKETDNYYLFESSFYKSEYSNSLLRILEEDGYKFEYLQLENGNYFFHINKYVENKYNLRKLFHMCRKPSLIDHCALYNMYGFDYRNLKERNLAFAKDYTEENKQIIKGFNCWLNKVNIDYNSNDYEQFAMFLLKYGYNVRCFSAQKTVVIINNTFNYNSQNSMYLEYPKKSFIKQHKVLFVILLILLTVVGVVLLYVSYLFIKYILGFYILVFAVIALFIFILVFRK